METVLICMSDLKSAALFMDHLRKQGFHAVHIPDGKAACETILACDDAGMVIVEASLSGLEGFELCRRVRPYYKGPILFMSDHDTDSDQILAFEIGADDFVRKPKNPEILAARVRAHFRRFHQIGQCNLASRVQIGELVVDAGRREVLLNHEGIVLTSHQFDLLWILASNAGKVVTRDEIYRRLYNVGFDGVDRTIDVYISRIRQKLGDDPASPALIKTVRGAGYLFADASTQAG